MFKRQSKTRLSTVIGGEATIRGDLVITDGVHVDGTIKGNVLSGGDAAVVLILSEQGVIEGDVRVSRVVINGKVTGDVHAASRVELGPRARVRGTVYYRVLEMASGAEVNGQLVHSPEPEQRMLRHEPPAPRALEDPVRSTDSADDGAGPGNT